VLCFGRGELLPSVGPLRGSQTYFPTDMQKFPGLGSAVAVVGQRFGISQLRLRCVAAEGAGCNFFQVLLLLLSELKFCLVCQD